MDKVKLVDYSDSDDENRAEPTPTPITFRGKRVYRRVIQSADKATPNCRIFPASDKAFRKCRRILQTPEKTLKSTRALFQTPEKGTPKNGRISKSAEKKTPNRHRKITLSSSESKVPRIRANFHTPEKETPTKKARWTRDELNRLKIALKAAVNPTIDEHWDLICKSLGGNHTIEECREQALKINWKPSTPTTSNNAKIPENPPQDLKDMRSPWTKAVHMRKSRKSIDCTNKFFSENTSDITLTDLNLDDSLFTMAFNTPPQQTRCARRPFLIRVVAEEDEEEDSSED